MASRKYYSDSGTGTGPVRSQFLRLNSPSLGEKDWTAVPEYRTVQSGLFIGLHLSLRLDCFFPRPDCIFRSGLRSQLAGPYGPVFFNGYHRTAVGAE